MTFPVVFTQAWVNPPDVATYEEQETIDNCCTSMFAMVFTTNPKTNSCNIATKSVSKYLKHSNFTEFRVIKFYLESKYNGCCCLFAGLKSWGFEKNNITQE